MHDEAGFECRSDLISSGPSTNQRPSRAKKDETVGRMEWVCKYVSNTIRMYVEGNCRPTMGYV
jgi:hypothetical protein